MGLVRTKQSCISCYDMHMRILVDVTQEQVAALAELAERRNAPRAEVIRQAIDTYVAANRRPISDYFGLWAKNGHTEDGQEYQDKIRAEWDREWDR